jgi:hypothetical protein
MENKISHQLVDLNEDYIFTNEKKGFASNISTDDIYLFLLYLDSLVFEMKSLLEIIEKFFKEIMLICYKENKLIKIGKILELQHGKLPWIEKLRKTRNHFTHNGCPYFAIDRSNNSMDFLIMKKNIHVFQKEGDFIRSSEIKDTYKNLFKYIISVIDETEILLNTLKK